MYGKIAENHYGVPQDVEWGIVAGTIYILQSRPITTIGKNEAKGMSGQNKDAKILLKGQGAAPVPRPVKWSSSGMQRIREQ